MEVEQLLQHPDILEYKIVNTSEISFSPSVREVCKENSCGRYGTCWTCPPGVGEEKELQKRILRFLKAAVFTCIYPIEDSFDEEGMAEGASETQGILRELTDELRAERVNFMALGCEGCHICTKCNYPGTACRFPERAIPPIEACGIDVADLAKQIGMKYNNGPGTVTYFCMILFEENPVGKQEDVL